MIAIVQRAGFSGSLADNNKSSAYDDQYDAEGRRNFFIMFGRNANVGVSDPDSVMLGMRHWNKERNNSQDQNNNSS